jgi:pimeloyl-ACP methyl ester carboxylesterase
LPRPSPLRCLVLAVLSALLVLGCSSKSKRGLVPLAERNWLVKLEVKGFEPAQLAVPLGATSARPIAVVVHGEGDRPEWQCGSFRGVLGGDVFVLCPAGMPLANSGGLYGLGPFDDRIAELRAALSALKARFAAHVAASPVLLIGYGEGAMLAAELARQEPSFFARVALVNGDPAGFSSSASKIFASRGGKRVLFYCLTDACRDGASQRALWLSRSGVATKVSTGRVGPFLDLAFTDALRGDMPWLVEDDARFGKRQR